MEIQKIWCQQRHGGPKGPGQGFRGGPPSGGGSRGPDRQETIWPPQRILDLLRDQMVHPTYRLTVFCEMSAGKGGFEPSGGREKAYEETIKAITHPERSSLAKAWRARRQSWLEPLVQKGLARTMEVVAQTRVVLWLSSPSATELGFCLHHVYGLPYLPPSGMKGLASSAMWRDKDSKFERSSSNPYRPPREVLDLFGEGGDQGHEGRVAFLDGIPLGDEQGKITLEIDVMTPHHAQYYSGGGVAHDCEGPVPLPFLCIPAGQRFEVALVCTDASRSPSGWLDEAKKWLLKGFEEIGFGAKTTSGYGVLVEKGQATLPDETAAASPAPSSASGTAEAQSGISASPEEFIATIVRIDRNQAKGWARADDGHEFEFEAVRLAQKLNIYRQDWPKLVGQRLYFRKEGDKFVPVRKEGGS